jgi:hypothetical protein
METITTKEWTQTPADYKHIFADGTRRVLRNCNGATVSVPVRVDDCPVCEGPREENAGDICIACSVEQLLPASISLDPIGQNCIYQHDHAAEPSACVWHD